MQCSICEKMFAATLSVCPSCGAMQTQHNQAEASLRLLSIEKICTSDLELEIADSPPAELVSAATENEFNGSSENQPLRRGQPPPTTLLEFPAKKSKDQEWREEIKNRIRQRKEGVSSTVAAISGTSAARPAANQTGEKPAKTAQAAAKPSLVINLKPKLAERQNAKSKDLVAEALKRIERSREKFENDEFIAAEMSKDALLKLSEGESKRAPETSNSTLTLVPTRRVLPVVTTEDDLAGYANQPSAVRPERKSVFTVPLNIPPAVPKPKNEIVRESEIVDIGDLDDDDAIAASLESVRKISVRQALLGEQELTERISSAARSAARRQSNEDYAPLTPRLAAGGLDALLCGIGTTTFLHYAFGGTLGTGWLGAAVMFAGILFVYSTAALMFTGTTLGLRLFGMSVVTAEDGDVPTILQTAISNAVYLLTLATGGLGLLTVFFGSEQRTVHDLLSGTVVIRE